MKLLMFFVKKAICDRYATNVWFIFARFMFGLLVLNI